MKMLALDLDGTVLGPNGRVSERTRMAIRSAINAGVFVCFATGRTYGESRDVLAATEHYDLGVYVGGATVVDGATGETVYVHRMQPQLAAELCGFLESANCAVMALQDRVAAGIDYLVTDGLPLQPAFVDWMRIMQSTHRKVPRGQLELSDHGNTIRISIAENAQAMSALREKLDAKFGQRIISHTIFVPAYGVEVLEIFDPAVTKWSGVQRVAKMRQIADDQIVAVGDDVNDIPMLKSAGLGVAMGNAKPHIQAIAKRVIGTNAEDGLAQFVEEMLKK